MPIPFRCSACGIEGNAYDWFVGRRAKCSCGNVLDFQNSNLLSEVEIGKVKDKKLVDKRTGLDRRVELRPQLSEEKRSGKERRDG